MKNKYILDLKNHQHVDSEVIARTPNESDLNLLADLMMDAYRGTTDWRDQTYEDAIAEVKSFFASTALLSESVLITDDKIGLCACLVMYLEKQQAPLIAYIMTAKNGKRKGLARQALQEVLNRLSRAGHTRALAGITDGNTPSENLFLRFGFEQVA